MSKQMLYQSMGNMVGSLAGGILFDLSQHFDSHRLNWLLLALASVVMVILSKNKIPQLYRQAGNMPSAH
jgi:predicted MFS family arabinose efflux permease